ncbi:SDR family NAD(P)-dependent oxidoreductase [Sphingomonadaceae bacterium G21617-S1]|nr:SDR family NAD(P)-dependent oxidoreductase [Sphingomonadaceae bacterium G21617-S1]
MMGLLQDKTVLVTGATGGLGQAASILFAREGANVIATARREKEGSELVAKITADGHKARFIQADISDEASVAELFAQIERDFDRLDGAFNNTGIQPDAAPIYDIPLSEFDRTLNTNVLGTYRCMQHEGRIMREQGFGSIVNTSSGGGVRALLNSAAYCTSKFAIVGMTRVAAIDMAQWNVRVNCLCPGAFRSPMLDDWVARVDGLEDLLVSAVPLSRVASPFEMAEGALFMLSDRSSYMTGVPLLVDGGLMTGHNRG